MPPRRSALAFALLLLGHPAAGAARPSQVPDGFVDEFLVGELAEPVGLAEVPDPPATPERRVLFVEQRSARVGMVIGRSTFTVGTVPGVASVEYERGLLGVAVDPKFPERPYVYVHLTDARDGGISLSRFTLTGDLSFTGTGALQLDPGSRYDLLRGLPDAASNHNGGTVRFDPDGALYMSLGDDASGCPALDPNVPVGKILRLAVDRLPAEGTGPAPTALLELPGNPFATASDSSARLVWAYGLRNPFRFQIDPAKGVLFIGDVGENEWEELNRVEGPGVNLGWPENEGLAPFQPCAGEPLAAHTLPIAAYDHPTGFTVIAGPCYRVPASGPWRFPTDYDGDAFFLDYFTGFLRRVERSTGRWQPAPAVPGQPNATDWGTGFEFVADMIELSDGTVWYCRQFDGGTDSGEIRRIRSAVPVAAAAAPRPEFVLAAPAPSPARGPVSIAWTQSDVASVELALYDTQGRRIRRLARGERAAGSHRITWAGDDDAGRTVGAGVYFVRLEVGAVRREARLTRLP